jgi:hypothetical protein
MKHAIQGIFFLGAVLASAGAWADNETVCAQGIYSTPCPKVIWCAAKKCGIGLVRADGDIDIIYSSESKMDGGRKTPFQAGKAMSLEHIAGRVIVFEWEDDTSVPDLTKDLVIKNIDYVIMSPPQSG